MTNVFHAFRGASRVGGDERAAELARATQLEDNVTKALINVLEHGDVDVRERFLELIGVGRNAASNLRYFMQRAPKPGDVALTRRHRVLLGIVPAGERGKRVHGSRTSQTGARRPDAWIVGSDLSVLVESKVDGALDDEQWRDHRATLNAGGPDGVVEKELSWKDVHDALAPLASGTDGSELSRWLVRQFVQYLELENIVGFTGIGNEVFDYFFEPGDEETRLAVKKTTTAFADELLVQLQRINPWFAGCEVGNLKSTDSHCWAAFGPMGSGAADKASYRQHAHLTVSVRSTGVDVFANIELKSAVDDLRRALGERRAAVLDALRGLRGHGFELRIEERKQRQASLYDYAPVAAAAIDYLFEDHVGDAMVTHVVHLIETLPLPYVTIVRSIPRAEVVAGGAVGIIDAVRDAAARLDPFVRLVNGRG